MSPHGEFDACRLNGQNSSCGDSVVVTGGVVVIFVVVLLILVVVEAFFTITLDKVFTINRVYV